MPSSAHAIRRLRPLALGLALTAVLAPGASAAGWLPAANLSTPGATSVSSTAAASDAAGESFVTWAGSDGTNVRVFVAGHGPGTGWSAPTALSDPGRDASLPVLAMAASGWAAAAWVRSDGTNQRVEVVRRAPGHDFGAPSIISAPAIDARNPVVAVDDAGDVQVAWTDSNLAVHTARYVQATGAWSTITDLASAAASPSNQFLLGLTLVMSRAGVATVAWSIDTDATTTLSLNVFSRSQDASGTTWLAPVTHSTTASPNESARPQLAIADDGTVTMVWMQYTTTGCGFLCSAFAVPSVVRAQTRSAAGTWGPAQTISDPALISDNPTVATSPAGETTVIWNEGAANAIKALTRTVGGAFPVASAAVIITQQDRAITSGNFFGLPISSLHVSAGATGTVVTYLRTDGANAIANAVFRPAGGLWPNPLLVAPATLSAPGADAGLDGLIASFDAAGDIVTSWVRDGVLQSSTYDASAPAFTLVDVPATGTVGVPVAMGSATGDAWGTLAAGQPSWAFGDGAAGSGLAVTHAYGAPGTYTVTVGAADTAANVAVPVTRTITIAAAPVPPVAPLPATTVTAPTQKVAWKSGKLSGTITIGGTVGAPATLTITVRPHSGTKVAAKVSFTAKAGAWSQTIALPKTLAPGRYDVTVSGPVVKGSATSFTLGAPASGLLSRSYASGPRSAPAATTIGHTSQLWAHFRFSTLPKKGQRITTQWILPNGRKLSANTRPRSGLVEAQVKDLTGKTLPTGRWRCVLKVGTTTLATVNVRLK